jgi:hypothetical protein
MFIAYRIRPVVESTDPDGEVSYRAAASLEEAEREINESSSSQVVHGREGKALFWGLYGVNPLENGVSTEEAISDTLSEDSAKKLLVKIIGQFEIDEHGYCKGVSPSPISSNTPPEGMDYWKDEDSDHPVHDWEHEVADGDPGSQLTFTAALHPQSGAEQTADVSLGIQIWLRPFGLKGQKTLKRYLRARVHGTAIARESTYLAQPLGPVSGLSVCRQLRPGKRQ